MHVIGVLQEHLRGHHVRLPARPGVRGLRERLAQRVDVVARGRQPVDIGLLQRRDQGGAAFDRGRGGPDRLEILRPVEGGEAFIGRRCLRNRLAERRKGLRLGAAGQDRRYRDRCDGKGQRQQRNARKSQTHDAFIPLRGEFSVSARSRLASAHSCLTHERIRIHSQFSKLSPLDSGCGFGPGCDASARRPALFHAVLARELASG
jgi:hypothetical protein